MAVPVNLLLLIELAAVIVASTAFLFYWNRLLASFVAFLIRLYAWRVHHAYISIGSLQISPLAGRLSFRNAEYHSSKLPCRIIVYAKGVEAFVYNRTPAYDDIVERMKKHENEAGGVKGASHGYGDFEEELGLRARLKNLARMSTKDSSAKGTPSDNGHSSSSYPPVTHELPAQVKPVKPPPSDSINWFREALPLELRVVAGSIVLGNDATPTLLIGDFKRAEGILETSDSRSLLDLYKMAVELKFHEANVLTRTNVDYSGPLLAHGKKVYDELLKQQVDLVNKPPSTISVFSGFHFLSRQFPFLYDPKFSTAPVPGLPTDKLWKGLARYRLPEDDTIQSPRKEGGDEREYAKATNLLEAPELTLTYYADIPGNVPDPLQTPYGDILDEIGNVDLPPEYGIDIIIRKGTVKYGPWADRQREALQKAFAPALFFDSEPKARLRPGDTRVHTALVLRVMLEDETVLRIPTREKRRYGWLDVVVGPNSSVTYTQDQIATQRGYDSMLVLHLDSLGISSSVNLDTFIQAKTCKLSMAMPTPLQWNAKRDWGMDVVFDTPSISLLRDHVTLISDLAKDWSSGTTGGDYHHFVPNHYNFRVSLINYAFHLYINDYNIVDAPGSRDSNAFMDVYGPRLDAVVAVASTQYRPETSVVPFSISLSDARVELCVPKWDTHRTFGPEVLEVGQVGQLIASGSYRYYAVPRPEHQETLTLHLEGKHVKFKMLGWVLRRLFCVKDNYFGSFTQFTTMDEFLERFDHDPASVGDPVEEKYRPGRSDPYAVHITMNVEESLILMCDEIYNFSGGIALPVPQLQMTIKSVEQFMELSLNATPTYIAAAPQLLPLYERGSAPVVSGEEAIFIEGIELKASRLFGPKPRATTYLCLWEANIPKISAFLTPSLLTTLQAIGRSVGYTFSDPDNAPDQNYQLKTPPDVTFFKFSINHALAMLTADSSAISLEALSGLTLDTSTWGTRSYSSNIGLLLPSFTINIVHRSPRKTWRVVSSAAVGATLDVYNAPDRWRERVSAQQEFLKEQDSETGRVWYMYRGGQKPMEMIDEEESESLLSEKHGYDSNDSQPSSSIESGPEESNPSKTWGKRNPVKPFMTIQETDDSSVSSAGDESDSASGTSSDSASEVSFPAEYVFDMADVLANKLRHFQFARDRYPPEIRLSASDSDYGGGEEEIKGKRKARDEMASGKVVRLVTHAAQVNLHPESLQSISEIVSAISTGSVSYEKRLDSLLISQVQDVADSKIPEQQMVLDIHVPSATMRLSGGEPSSALISHIQHIRCNIHRYTLINQRPVLDLIFSVVSITASAMSSSDTASSLKDIVGPTTESPEYLPLAHFVASAITAGFHSGHGIRIHSKVSHAHFDTVTPAITFGSAFAERWQAVIQEANFSHPKTGSDAAMLCHILYSAINSQRGAYLPSFAYVTPHGLHEQDSQLGNRRQTGWWLLTRFRDWLRGGLLDEADVVANISDMANYFVSNLIQVDDSLVGTENLVRDQPFFKRAFNIGSSCTPETECDTPIDVFVYIDNASVRHYGRLLGSTATAMSYINISKLSFGCATVIAMIEERKISQMRMVVAIQTVGLEVHDSILTLARLIVHIPCKPKPEFGKGESPGESLPSFNAIGKSPSAIAINIQLETLDATIIGGGLRLRSGARQLQLTALTRHRLHSNPVSGRSTRESLSLTCRLIEIILIQPVENPAAITHSTDRVVISLKTQGWRASGERIASVDKPSTEIRAMAGLKLLEFDSRPQLRAFYSFIQQWKAKELPLYASAVDDMKGAIKAWTNGPPSKSTPVLLTDLDITIEALHFQVRAAKALWLRWEVGKIYVVKSEKKKDIRFAVKVAPQVVGAYYSRRSKSSESSSLNLPSVAIIGNHRHLQDKPHVFANLQLGLFSGVLRPAILDRLLSLHQNLQDDINHLVNDWRKDVRKAKEKLHAQKGWRSPSPGARKVSLNKILYDVHVRVDGVRFGLRADDVPATIVFEALAAKGRATNQYHHGNGLHWRAKVDHFSLSLGHLDDGYVSNDTEPFRRQRTASMTLDVEVEEIPATPLLTSQLIIHLSHVRTVMHVEALSELTDLLKSWSSDLYILRDHRAREMAEVKQRTTKVLKRFESAEHVNRSEISWLANRLLTVEIGGIGVAIPLVEGAVIEDCRKSDVPALLYSIRVISFHNRHNEAARFRLQNMALQFIDRFDQSLPEHFTSDFHGSKNCMVVPSIESEAEMSSTHEAWHLSAHCSASDFKLTLSPDISDDVIQLVELFERGKEKIAKVEAQYKVEVARHAKETIASKYESPASPSARRQSQRIMVRTSFTFNSGTVELHRDLSDTEKATLSSETRRGRGWHDTVVLPAVSLWMEYTGPKDEVPLFPQDEGDGSLLFNLAVHESRNLLRPTILPFFLQIANRLGRKAKRTQSTPLDTSPKMPMEVSPAVPQGLSHRPITRTVSTRVQVSVTLRIDKSELRLSCAPDSNAYVDLKWKSGGFFASTIIGDGSKATVAGTVSGVRAYLRHEFAEGKSCIEAGAKDMAFSIDYSFESLTGRKYLSIVLDSLLSAQFRLEQFSAWLAFAAVWLDNAPNLELPSRPPLGEASSSSPSIHTASIPKVTVSALVRFRTVDFDTNIGVTNAKLEMTPVVLRTSSNGVKAELELDLGVTQITAKGDISGEIRSESLIFRTARQSSRGGAPDDPTVLNMSINAGTLSSNLSLQELSVIRFTLDPATVTLADDWQAFAQDPSSQVLLSFAVKAGVFRSVIRLLSIPSLVSKFYSLSNTIESQERMACHRSSAYKSKRLRKSTEPSPMAAAILHTARKTGQTLTSTSTVKTAQNMRFDLGGVDIGLFNSPPTDDHRGDFYRFTMGKVEADLERQLTAENLPKRDLNLLVSYVKWVSSDGVKAAREVKKHRNLEESIQAASAHGRKEIASLPLMTMTMDSIEESKPPVLVYDFDLVWGDGDLDIAIMPYFFEQVYKTFDKLIKGLDQEQITKAKRRGDGGTAKDRSHATSHEKDQECIGAALAFRRRLEGQRPLPVPRLRLLGEATGEAMAWVPKINAANAQLPIMVHRFVTSPLEDGMDLLLKLYEKQLPDRVQQQM
ncbi:hypothetical protein CNBC5720 [Cryptococcus deneoformans B-3501A]|uniref:hypothetical protein n=1 Tax=Cryptococcus deneoformans (strain B-3501A) TaxID=283643 RepID=UPI00004302A6|nr:hypothetical protein CNBC5720 [Cryptococcus neoformans var. neoformans B-3501A]EAL21708.1 hypothetical protein CNBC5720 [Cryptococcus neoformans var. neoformans B-3501A]